MTQKQKYEKTAAQHFATEKEKVRRHRQCQIANNKEKVRCILKQGRKHHKNTSRISRFSLFEKVLQKYKREEYNGFK